MDDLIHHLEVTVATKRAATDGDLEHQRAEREQIAAAVELLAPALLRGLFGNMFVAAMVVLPMLVLGYILLYRIAHSERLGLLLTLDVLSLSTSLLMLLLLCVSLFPFDEGDGYQPGPYFVTFILTWLCLGVVAGVPTLYLSFVDLKKVIQKLRPPMKQTHPVVTPTPVEEGTDEDEELDITPGWDEHPKPPRSKGAKPKRP